MLAAAPAKAPENPWDLTQAPTETILARLEARGLRTDRDLFRVHARRAGSPSALADVWIRQAEPASARAPAPARAPVAESPGPPDDGSEPHPPSDGAPADAGAPEAPGTADAPLVAAAWELWKRWAPDLDCAELLAEEFDRHYEPLDGLLLGSPHLLREALSRAHRILAACRRPGEPPDQELFREIWGHCWHDLALWLRFLPLVLAQREMLAEAIRLCEELAPLCEARLFLSERGLLLARAGRTAEARRQVSDNVRRWPRDPVVLRKACETLWSLGHADEALLLYDEVLGLLNRS